MHGDTAPVWHPPPSRCVGGGSSRASHRLIRDRLGNSSNRRSLKQNPAGGGTTRSLNADTVNVSAAVPGRIAVIEAKDNASLGKDALLFALDATSCKLRAEQAAADLRIAEAALADRERAVSAARSSAVIAQEQVGRARSNLDLASQTLARIEMLRPSSVVSGSPTACRT